MIRQPRPRPTTASLATLVLMASTALACLGSDGKLQGDVAGLNPARRGSEKKITREQLQAEVQRFARTYFAWNRQVVNEGLRSATLPADRLGWLATKVQLTSTTISIASGPDPLANLLDMMVFTRILANNAREMVTVSPTWLESETHLREETAAQFATLDAQIWTLGGRVLKPEQLESLDELIAIYHQRNPEIRAVTAARFGEFARDQGETELFQILNQGALSSIGLMPQVGDLTTAVDEAREISERLFFYLDHLHYLLAWQSELVVYETLAQPGVQSLIADTSRLATTSDRIAAVLGDLPAQSERLERLSADVRHTLATGNELAASVNEALRAIDGLRGDGPASAPGEGFDIAEYERAAQAIGAAAQQIDAAANSLDRMLSGREAGEGRIASLVDAAGVIETKGAQLVDRAYGRALTVVAFTLLGCVLAGLAFQAASRALFGSRA